MEMIDLSQPLEEGSLGNPDYPRPRIERIMERGADRWETELITIAVHSGTHIDAPNHKLAQWKGLEQFPLNSFTGRAVLADLRGCDARHRIGPQELKARLPRRLSGRIVLLATGWGYKNHDTRVWYEDIPFISPDAAHWLLEQKVRAVGIDHWSIGGPEDPDKSLVHTILMASNVWIIENMRFPEAVFTLPEPFEILCLPVNMPAVTAALCRPVAVVRKARKAAPVKPHVTPR
jgi:kynurenine formamidase